MMAMWMNAEMTALTQPPFFLSRPADSIRTSSNIAGTSGSGLMPTWALGADGAYSRHGRRASGFTETCRRIDAALTTAARYLNAPLSRVTPFVQRPYIG